RRTCARRVRGWLVVVGSNPASAGGRPERNVGTESSHLIRRRCRGNSACPRSAGRTDNPGRSFLGRYGHLGGGAFPECHRSGLCRRSCTRRWRGLCSSRSTVPNTSCERRTCRIGRLRTIEQGSVPAGLRRRRAQKCRARSLRRTGPHFRFTVHVENERRGMEAQTHLVRGIEE